MSKRFNFKNFSNRGIYTLFLIILIGALGFVIALTPGVAPNPGHLISEVAPPSPCQSNFFLQFNGNNWVCSNVSAWAGGGSGGSGNPGLWSSGTNGIYYNSGNVSIGITSSNSRLTIKGDGGNIFNLQDSVGAEKVTVLNNGNVGIGITAPETKLVVSGWSVVNAIPVNQILSGSYPGVMFLDTDNSGYGSAILGYNGQLEFWTKNATGDFVMTNRRMTITNIGDVGIGTVNPKAKLEVDGSMYIMNGNVGIEIGRAHV